MPGMIVVTATGPRCERCGVKRFPDDYGETVCWDIFIERALKGEYATHRNH